MWDWGLALTTAGISFGTVMAIMVVLVMALFISGYIVRKIEARTHVKVAAKTTKKAEIKDEIIGD